MQKLFSAAMACVLYAATLSAQTHGPETVMIETPYGTMKLKLFMETPRHRENFLALVKRHYYDSLLFHRVINEFMIQGGDTLSKRVRPGDTLGHGESGRPIPAEFNPAIFHRKGRLAAAREGDDVNPEKASSSTQFYIVQGKVRTQEDLKKYEDRINKVRHAASARKFIMSDQGKALRAVYNRLKREEKADSVTLVNAQIESEIEKLYRSQPEYKYSPQQVETYTTVGGTPHLDGSYTVFGEVIDGLRVIDKIAAVEKDKHDRPLKDVRMRIYIKAD